MMEPPHFLVAAAAPIIGTHSTDNTSGLKLLTQLMRGHNQLTSLNCSVIILYGYIPDRYVHNNQSTQGGAIVDTDSLISLLTQASH